MVSCCPATPFLTSLERHMCNLTGERYVVHHLQGKAPADNRWQREHCMINKFQVVLPSLFANRVVCFIGGLPFAGVSLKQ